MKPRARRKTPAPGIAAMGLLVGLLGCGPGFPGSGGSAGSGGSPGSGGTAASGGTAGSAGSTGGSIGIGGTGSSTDRGGAGGSIGIGGTGSSPDTGSGGSIGIGGTGGSPDRGGAGGSIGIGGTGGSPDSGSGGSIGIGGSGGSTGTTTSTATITDTLPGPGITGPSPVSSGARLRARMRDGGSGAVAFAGFLDTQIQQPCSFIHDEDGVLRCIPDADSRASIRYLDSDCTQPVIALSCGSQATYVPVKSGPAGCERDSEPWTVYQAGAAVNPRVTYAHLGASCLVKSPDPSIQFREAVPVLPDTFVAANIEDEAHGSRTTLRVVTGDDGSRETRIIQDAQLNTGCTPQWAAIGERRCLPTTDLMGALFYADAQCGSPLIVRMQNGQSCPAPGYGLLQGSAVCTDVFSSVSVGSAVTPQAIYQGDPRACTPTAIVPGNWGYYEQGAAVPAGSFLLLRRQEMGTSRLRVPVDTTTDGLQVLPPKAFRDSQRKLDCTVHKFSDGSLRCVPMNVATLKFYADDQCTIPVVTLIEDPVCHVPGSTEMILTEPPVAPGCTSDVVQHVHSVGAPFAGPSVYRRTSNNGCSPLDASSLNVHDLGPEISADVFSLVVEQID